MFLENPVDGENPKDPPPGMLLKPGRKFHGISTTKFPSLNWLVSWTRISIRHHQPQDPMSAVILDDGFSMLTGEDVKKRCLWCLKIPDFGQRVEHQPVEPFCRTLVLVGKSWWLLGVDHQK